MNVKTNTLPEMQPFLGKRVLVTTTDGVEIPGELQFVGFNKLFPKLGLHCTVGRTPHLKINSINDIQLVPEKSLF